MNTSCSSADTSDVESVPDALLFSRDAAAHAYGSIAALVGADSDTEYSGSDDDGGGGGGGCGGGGGGDGDGDIVDDAVALARAPWSAARGANDGGGAAVSALDVASCAGTGAGAGVGAGATPSRLSMLETFVQRAHATWATRLAGEAVGEFVRDDAGGGGAPRGHANGRALDSDSEGDDSDHEVAAAGDCGDGDDGDNNDDDDDDERNSDSEDGESAHVRTLSCASCFAELARGETFSTDVGSAGQQWTLSAQPPPSLLIIDGARETAESLGVRGRSADALLLPLRCASCHADVGGRDSQGGVSVIIQGIANGFAL